MQVSPKALFLCLPLALCRWHHNLLIYLREIADQKFPSYLSCDLERVFQWDENWPVIFNFSKTLQKVPHFYLSPQLYRMSSVYLKDIVLQEHHVYCRYFLLSAAIIMHKSQTFLFTIACHISAGASHRTLASIGIVRRLGVCRLVDRSLYISLRPHSYRRDVASFSLFSRYFH